MGCKHPVSPREILRKGKVRGHVLTTKQKRLFGWKAGGSKPRPMKPSRTRKRPKRS